MNELIKLLEDLHEGIDYETCETLVDDGILDSLDIVTLITDINDTFDVAIPPEEIVPENFNSAKALWALIEKLDNI
ncbi:MAG: acyl carrier protein [Eubacteriales bacterium]